MWFVFGFITVLIFFIYFFQKKINARWKGDFAFSNGVPYQFEVIKTKFKTTALIKIGISSKDGYDFLFKKESRIDRFFKFIGLSVEYQVKNKEFDELVYVASDNAFFHRQITDKIEIKDAVVQIFKIVANFDCSLKEIRAQGGQLWVRIKTKKGFEKNNSISLYSEIVSQLSRISGALVELPENPHEFLKDPFVFKAAIILALSTALFINGMIQLFRIEVLKVPFTIDASSMALDSMLIGSIVILILIALSILLLRRSARVHLIIIELVLVGYLGAVSSSFAELRDINMELDGSKGTAYQVNILNKTSTRGRRSSSYYVYVHNWNSKSRDLKVEVSSGFYNTVSVGDQLLFVQKEGYLGYKWVERIEKIE